MIHVSVTCFLIHFSCRCICSGGKGESAEMKPSNGSQREKPTPAPRGSKGDAFQDDEGKKVSLNDKAGKSVENMYENSLLTFLK